MFTIRFVVVDQNVLIMDKTPSSICGDNVLLNEYLNHDVIDSVYDSGIYSKISDRFTDKPDFKNWVLNINYNTCFVF